MYDGELPDVLMMGGGLWDALYSRDVEGTFDCGGVLKGWGIGCGSPAAVIVRRNPLVFHFLKAVAWRVREQRGTVPNLGVAFLA